MQIDRLELVPVSEPLIALSDIKAHLIVEHDDDDELITRYVLAAIQFAEERTERSLRLRRHVAFGSCWPCGGVELEYGPVRQVESVSYLDTDSEVQQIAAADFEVFKRHMHERLHFINTPPPVNHCRRSAAMVTYTAGYGELPDTEVNSYGFPYTLALTLGQSSAFVVNPDHAMPENFRQAIYMLVGHWYENRETVVVGTGNGAVAIAAEALLGQVTVYGV